MKICTRTRLQPVSPVPPFPLQLGKVLFCMLVMPYPKGVIWADIEVFFRVLGDTPLRFSPADSLNRVSQLVPSDIRFCKSILLYFLPTAKNGIHTLLGPRSTPRVWSWLLSVSVSGVWSKNCDYIILSLLIVLYRCLPPRSHALFFVDGTFIPKLWFVLLLNYFFTACWQDSDYTPNR